MRERAVNESEQTVHRDSEELVEIVKLRLAVGLLGEKDHGNWWSSLWATPNATAFLAPIYGARTNTSKYHGLVEAARRVHDNRIGVGRAFHLFRLPEALERRIHDAVVKDNLANSSSVRIETKEGAETVLCEFAGQVEASTGPIRLGNVNDLQGRNWLQPLAGQYLGAFRSNQQTFPYYTEAL